MANETHAFDAAKWLQEKGKDFNGNYAEINKIDPTLDTKKILQIGSLITDMKVREVNSRKRDANEAAELLQMGYADFVKRTSKLPEVKPTPVPAPAPVATAPVGAVEGIIQDKKEIIQNLANIVKIANAPEVVDHLSRAGITLSLDTVKKTITLKNIDGTKMHFFNGEKLAKSSSESISLPLSNKSFDVKLDQTYRGSPVGPFVSIMTYSEQFIIPYNQKQINSLPYGKSGLAWTEVPAAVAASPDPIAGVREQAGAIPFKEITQRYNEFNEKDLVSIQEQDALYTPELFMKLRGQDYFEAKRQHGYVLYAKVIAILEQSPTDLHARGIPKLHTQYMLEGYYTKNPSGYKGLQDNLSQILKDSIVASLNGQQVNDRTKSQRAKDNAKDTQEYLTWIREFTPEKLKGIIEARRASTEAERVSKPIEVTPDASAELSRLGIGLVDGPKGEKILRFGTTHYTISMVEYDASGAKKGTVTEDSQKLGSTLVFKSNTKSITFKEGTFTSTDFDGSKQEIRFIKKAAMTEAPGASAPILSERPTDVSAELLKYGITPEKKKLMEGYGLTLTWNPGNKIDDAKRKALEAAGFKVGPISNIPESIVIKGKPETRKIGSGTITTDDVIYFSPKSKSFPSVSQIEVLGGKAIEVIEKDVSGVKMLSISRGGDEYLIPRDVEDAKKKLLKKVETPVPGKGTQDVTDLI